MDEHTNKKSEEWWEGSPELYTWEDYKTHLGLIEIDKVVRETNLERMTGVWFIKMTPYTQHFAKGGCKNRGEEIGFVFNIDKNENFREKLKRHEAELGIEIMEFQKSQDHQRYIRDEVFAWKDKVQFVCENAQKKRREPIPHEKEYPFCTLEGKNEVY
jgi:hypothetical protein